MLEILEKARNSQKKLQKLGNARESRECLKFLENARNFLKCHAKSGKSQTIQKMVKRNYGTNLGRTKNARISRNSEIMLEDLEIATKN